MKRRFTYNLTVYLELLILSILVIGIALYENNAIVLGYQNEKSFFFIVFLAGFIIVRCISILTGRKITALKITWLDILLGVYFIYIGINRYFISNLNSLTLFYTEFICLAVLYLAIRTIPSRYHNFLLSVLVVSGIIQAIYGNFQLYNICPSNHSLFKLTGGFFNPGPYAGYLISVLPVAIVLYLYYRKTDDKMLFNEIVNFFRNIVREFKHTKSVAIIWNNLKSSPVFTESSRGQGEQPPAYAEAPIGQRKPYRTILKLFYPLLLKYISLLAIITIILVLPASRSRAAWLAAIISGMYILYILLKNQLQFTTAQKQLITILKLFSTSSTTKKVLITISIAIITIAALYGIYKFKQQSANGRLLIWKTTSGMIVDKPITGYGYEKFNANYMNYQAAYFKQHPDSPFIPVSSDIEYAFNEFLKITTETGIPGLMLVLGLLGVLIFCKFSTHNREIMYAARAGILAVAIFALFAYPASISPIKINIAIFLALISARLKPVVTITNVINKPVSLMSPVLKTVTVFAFMLIVYLLSKQVLQLHEAYENWNDGYTVYQMGDYEASIKEYKKAYPVLYNNGVFMVNYGKALSMAAMHKEAINILTQAQHCLTNSIVYTALGDSYKATGNYAKAEQAYMHAWHMAPVKFYPKYLLAKLYNETGQTTKAIETARELLNKEVKVPSTAIEEIKTEMNLILRKNVNNN